jgi:hypothetical protein
MLRWFDLLMRLYPADWRAAFTGEMREVFRGAADHHPWRETAGLLCGAIDQQWQHAKRTLLLPSVFAMAVGLVVALAVQLVVYVSLLPHMSRTLERTLQELAAFLTLFCVLAGVAAGSAFAQQPVQDLATLELARSIYSRALAGLKAAKTMEELRKSAAKLDTEAWVSLDRFGRMVLTAHDRDRELELMLDLPPERRAAPMDIIWAERDGIDRQQRDTPTRYQRHTGA